MTIVFETQTASATFDLAWTLTELHVNFSGKVLWNGAEAVAISTDKMTEMIDFLRSNRFVDVFTTERDARRMNMSEKHVQLQMVA